MYSILTWYINMNWYICAYWRQWYVWIHCCLLLLQMPYLVPPRNAFLLSSSRSTLAHTHTHTSPSKITATWAHIHCISPLNGVQVEKSASHPDVALKPRARALFAPPFVAECGMLNSSRVWRRVCASVPNKINVDRRLLRWKYAPSPSTTTTTTT